MTVQKMIWVNFFHIYQPPNWPPNIIKKVTQESYRPLLRILLNNKNIRITLNVSGSLTKQLIEHRYDDVVNNIKKLVKRGQIELVGTAAYHPILPLLSEQEILRQIQLNNAINSRFFGKSYKPTGFFPPEMAYNDKMASVVQKAGFKWMIIDEIAAYGNLGHLCFDKRFIYKNKLFSFVFRNRTISDYISFHSRLKNPKEFSHVLETDDRGQQILITAMDGENLGHHRHGLDKLWKKLVSNKHIKTLTVSELLNNYKKTKIISPKKSSWSSQEIELKKKNPYVLWNDPGNPIHFHQWKLVYKTINLTSKNKKQKKYRLARLLLDRRLASDQFWWASAKPWWSARIIKEKTNELLEITSLLGLDDKIIRQYAQKIIKLTNNWQKTKKFLKISNQYLSCLKTVRYIGGKKISDN